MYGNILWAGGIFLRRPCRQRNIFGWLAITAGIIILLSMILPSGFWWFMLGVCLIAVGLTIRRWC